MCTKILMESIVATTHSVVNMGHYIVATTDSVVNMGHYIVAANDSVVNMGHYIIAANDSGVNMAFYIVAVTCFHKQSPYFADKMNFLKKSLAPFSLF